MPSVSNAARICIAAITAGIIMSMFITNAMNPRPSGYGTKTGQIIAIILSRNAERDPEAEAHPEKAKPGRFSITCLRSKASHG